MKSYLKYFVSTITILLSALSFIIIINFTVNTFGVFYGVDADDSLLSDTRFVKMEKLMSQCQRIEAIVFGTSRANAYKTKMIRDKTGLNPYNAAIPVGSFLETLRMLEWLINNKCTPKVIFIPISGDHLEVYARNENTHNIILGKAIHPDVINTPEYSKSFYIAHLISLAAFKANIKVLIKKIMGKDLKRKIDLYTGDTYYLWDDNFTIDKCSYAPSYISKTVMKKAIININKIKEVADMNGIKVFLLWNPQPINSQIKNIQVIRFLKLISPLFDNINRIPLSDTRLQNSDYYHDKSHAKDSLGKDVLLIDNFVRINVLINEINKHYLECQQPITK